MHQPAPIFGLALACLLSFLHVFLARNMSHVSLKPPSTFQTIDLQKIIDKSIQPITLQSLPPFHLPSNPINPNQHLFCQARNLPHLQYLNYIRTNYLFHRNGVPPGLLLYQGFNRFGHQRMPPGCQKIELLNLPTSEQWQYQLELYIHSISS